MSLLVSLLTFERSPRKVGIYIFQSRGATSQTFRGGGAEPKSLTLERALGSLMILERAPDFPGGRQTLLSRKGGGAGAPRPPILRSCFKERVLYMHKSIDMRSGHKWAHLHDPPERSQMQVPHVSAHKWKKSALHFGGPCR